MAQFVSCWFCSALVLAPSPLQLRVWQWCLSGAVTLLVHRQCSLRHKGVKWSPWQLEGLRGPLSARAALSANTEMLLTDNFHKLLCWVSASFIAHCHMPVLLAENGTLVCSFFCIFFLVKSLWSKLEPFYQVLSLVHRWEGIFCTAHTARAMPTSQLKTEGNKISALNVLIFLWRIFWCWTSSAQKLCSLSNRWCCKRFAAALPELTVPVGQVRQKHPSFLSFTFLC